MKASDLAMQALCESLASESPGFDTLEFQLELGELVGKWRHRYRIDAALQDCGYVVRNAAKQCRVTRQAVYKRMKVNRKRVKGCPQPA
jgi:transcriptional regulator of acetoin/glycerol metabolism